VDSSQSAGSWAWALLGSRAVDRLWQDGTLSDEHNVAAAERKERSEHMLEIQQTKAHMLVLPELLLQFADEASLDLVEILQLTEWNEDYDGLSAFVNFDLSGSREV
jgi:hypothetical protein